MTTAIQDAFGLAGTVLDRQYRIDEAVGEGGFGIVYRGRHISLDQPIAIKVLKGLDGGDPQVNAVVLSKFREEARLLYTLSQTSLNIVRAIDFGATTTPSGAWAPYMVLEWLEGRSLADDLAERRARGMRGRSLAETFALLEPIAEGLGAAHLRHVAHRDLKPGNVFLLASGAAGPRPAGAPQLKVLDFGIAKIMKDGEAAGTKGTFASFTWLYGAPEQLEPRVGATGLATDVYAFALLATELLTDRSPVDDRDVVSLMKCAMDPNVRPTPRARGAQVPDAVEAIFRRALAIDPKDRFPTVPDLWSALVSVRDARPSQTATALHAPLSASAGPGRSSSPSFHGASYGASPTPTTPRPMTAVPVSAPIGPPPGSAGGRPSAIATPSPMMVAPHLTHPGYPGSAMQGPQGPPPGTAPPGQWPHRVPFVRADGGAPLVAATIVFFVLAGVLAGGCALLHQACNAVR